MARKKRQPPPPPSINMTPMIDCVFQLLIFFLVAAEVKPTEADFTTNLPAGSGPLDKTVPLKEPRRVYLAYEAATGTVTVSLDGTNLGQAPEAFVRLLESLTKVAMKENMLLVIGGDPTVPVRYIANVLDRAVEAKVPAITFDKPRGGS